MKQLPRFSDEHVLMILYMRPARTEAGRAVQAGLIARLEIAVAIKDGMRS